MAIVYYAEKAQKGTVPAIDKHITRNYPQTFRYAQDISATGVDQTLSSDNTWRINSISFHFNNANVKDYSASVLRGRRVVEKYNDYLWIQTSNSLWQRIVLTEGFYTGAELATHLQNQLDANSEFSSLGITFTVAYDSLTGLFTITPSSGNVRYIHNNEAQTLPYRQSIAGHLFGFTATTAFGGTITSDTEVYGLGDEAGIIDETGSAATEHYMDDIHYLSIDQALHIVTNTANVEASIEVVYQDE